jgi:hypothetical protein
MRQNVNMVHPWANTRKLRVLLLPEKFCQNMSWMKRPSSISARLSDAGRGKLQNLIDKVFKTHRGRQIAIESFLQN